MKEVSEIKLDWMLNEMEDDGFLATEAEVVRILNSENLDDMDPTLVGYVLEMDSEWEAENNL